MSNAFCTPSCEYWEFGQDPACDTISVGECGMYHCPTKKLGDCPPKGYSESNSVKAIKGLVLEKIIK